MYHGKPEVCGIREHSFTNVVRLITRLLFISLEHLVDLLQQVKDFVEQNKSPAFGHLNAYDLRHMPGDASTLICVFLVDYVSDFTAP